MADPIRIHFVHTSGSALGLAIAGPAADYYDFAAGAFGPLPAAPAGYLPVPPTTPLPEVVRGLYRLDFADPLPDGEYEVLVTSGASGGTVIAAEELRIRAGKLVTPYDRAPFPRTATLTFDAPAPGTPDA